MGLASNTSIAWVQILPFEARCLVGTREVQKMMTRCNDNHIKNSSMAVLPIWDIINRARHCIALAMPH